MLRCFADVMVEPGWAIPWGAVPPDFVCTEGINHVGSEGWVLNDPGWDFPNAARLRRTEREDQRPMVRYEYRRFWKETGEAFEVQSKTVSGGVRGAHLKPTSHLKPTREWSIDASLSTRSQSNTACACTGITLFPSSFSQTSCNPRSAWTARRKRLTPKSSTRNGLSSFYTRCNTGSKALAKKKRQ